MNFRFPKSEKLKSRKLIEKIFSEGRSITKPPLKLMFLLLKNTEISQAAFAVPKRNFKMAVSRNRIKRQMRETYRLQKHEFLGREEKAFALFFLYIGKEKPRSGQLQKSMFSLLKKMNDESSSKEK